MWFVIRWVCIAFGHYCVWIESILCNIFHILLFRSTCCWAGAPCGPCPTHPDLQDRVQRWQTNGLHTKSVFKPREKVWFGFYWFIRSCKLCSSYLLMYVRSTIRILSIFSVLALFKVVLFITCNFLQKFSIKYIKIFDIKHTQ